MNPMNPKHIVSIVLACIGAAANALASQLPAYSAVFNIVAGLCVAVQPYLAMTSPKNGAAQ